MEVTQRTISNWLEARNFSKVNQSSPNLNQDELLLLKARAEEAEKQRLTSKTKPTPECAKCTL
jgi:hypothetical protein